MEPERATGNGGAGGDRTKLAAQRTRLAFERTLMAWIRTSLAMLTFGFTVYKFFQYLAEAEHVEMRTNTPRIFGLLMIGLGTVILLIAGVQHWRFLKKVKAAIGGRAWSLGLTATVGISLIGIFFFLATLLRLGPF